MAFIEMDVIVCSQFMASIMKFCKHLLWNSSFTHDNGKTPMDVSGARQLVTAQLF